MKDKFRTNFVLALPAALATLALYLFGEGMEGAVAMTQSAEWFRAVPYMLVIILALVGVNVLVVLLVGIVVTDAIGLLAGDGFTMLSVFESAGEGLSSMCELILVTLFAGGLMNLVRAAGGFEFLTRALTRRIKGRRGAEAVIALLTALTNLCTANNTIAILTMGSIARDLSQRYGVAARKSASLMDTASCVVQGIIPYGAQLLMASGLASVSPVAIIPHLYYPMALGVMVVFAILFNFPRTERTE